MKGITNKLNPQIAEKIEQDIEKYPGLMGKIKREMAEAFSPTDLSVTSAQVLIGYFDELGLKADFDDFVIKLYAVFGK